jgi:hypothetical protein
MSILKIRGKHARNTLFRKFCRESGTNLKDVKREYYKLPHNKRYGFKRNLRQSI